MSDTLIRGHWHRGDDAACLRAACGRPRSEHVEAVGEWMDPVHWHRPLLLNPRWCATCGRHAAHSTHRLSREWRRLRR